MYIYYKFRLKFTFVDNECKWRDAMLKYLGANLSENILLLIFTGFLCNAQKISVHIASY